MGATATSRSIFQGRTGGFVGTLGHGVDSQAGTPRKDDEPQNWLATDPSTSGHQPHNWAGRSSGKSGPSSYSRSRAGLPQVSPRAVCGCPLAPWWRFRGAPLVGMFAAAVDHVPLIRKTHFSSGAKWLLAQGVPPTSSFVLPRPPSSKPT